MAPKQPRCIFCDGPNVTGEHVWPKWMHGTLVPREAEHHHNFETKYHWLGGGADDIPHKRQGPFRNREVYIACASCNGGWMGEIETGAQHVIRTLCESPTSLISTTDQIVLARWATLRSIVVQFTLDESFQVPWKDRMELRHGMAVPDGWRVWVGLNEASNWRPRMVQGWAFIGQRGTEIHANTQTTLIGFDKLFLYSQRSPYPDVAAQTLGVHERMCLKQIWPNWAHPVRLPDFAICNDIANVLRTVVIDEADNRPN